MAEHLTNEAQAVAEKVGRRLHRRRCRPRTISADHLPEPRGTALSSRHPVEDDGWITVLPRPWDAGIPGRSERDA